jgi:hypothetical protein
MIQDLLALAGSVRDRAYLQGADDINAQHA